MYDDDAWLDFRSEVHEYMKNKEETMLKQWLTSISYHEPVGYYRDTGNNTMILYATRPGLLIGKAGKHVAELEKRLNEEFFGTWKVSFVEIKGDIIEAKKEKTNDKHGKARHFDWLKQLCSRHS